MDPYRSTYRSQWRTPYVPPPTYSSAGYGLSGRTFSSNVPSVPIGVSYSSRSLALSMPSPPSPRRRHFEDVSESSSSGTTSRPSYRSSRQPSNYVDHYDVSSKAPSSPQSSKLSRKIDQFLQSSEEKMDRIKRRSSNSTISDASDLSLSLSSRAFRSTSAASIAVKAGKHFESLTENNKKVNGGSASESLDNLDSESESDEDEDVSDDTSADLSKLSTDAAEDGTDTATASGSSSSSSVRGPLPSNVKAQQLLDDLSSDSDDEFFDLIPLGNRNPELKVTTGLTKKLTETPNRVPSHSQSVPAVNKVVAETKTMAGGGSSSNNASSKTKTTTNSNVAIEAPTKSTKQPAPQPPDRAVTPSPSVKKYPAPQPPGSISRQASSASIARLSTGSDAAALLAAGLARQHSSSSIARNPVAMEESSGKKCQRSASIKKYPAPLPPGVSRQNSMSSIASVAANDKYKPLTNGIVVSDNSNHKLLNGIQDNEKENKVSNLSKKNENLSKGSLKNGRLSNGHIEDVLSEFKRGASESLNLLKNGKHKSEQALSNGIMKSDEISKTVSKNSNSSLDKQTNINVKKQSSSREVSVENSSHEHTISRSSSSEPSSKRSLTGKFAVMANKFECDSTSSSSVSQKYLHKSRSEVKPKQITNKPGVNKLGSLASKFEANESSSENKNQIIGKLQSPYSKPFDPEPLAQPVEKRKSIGGINVSKFGGTGKFPSQSQLKKSSTAGINIDESSETKDVASNTNNLNVNAVVANKEIPKTETLTNGSIKNSEADSSLDSLSKSSEPNASIAPLAVPESTELSPEEPTISKISQKEDACILSVSSSDTLSVKEVNEQIPTASSTISSEPTVQQTVNLEVDSSHTNKLSLLNDTNISTDIVASQQESSDSAPSASASDVNLDNKKCTSSNDISIVEDKREEENGNELKHSSKLSEPEIDSTNVPVNVVDSSITNVTITSQPANSDSLSTPVVDSNLNSLQPQTDISVKPPESNTSENLPIESIKSEISSVTINPQLELKTSLESNVNAGIPPVVSNETNTEPSTQQELADPKTTEDSSQSKPNISEISSVTTPQLELKTSLESNVNAAIPPVVSNATNTEFLTQRELPDLKTTEDSSQSKPNLSLSSSNAFGSELLADSISNSLPSPEYYSPTLQLLQPRFTSSISANNDIENLRQLSDLPISSSFSNPVTSIYTRSSSVAPSISPYLAGTGLNVPYSNFIRARSLTPVEGLGERSVRPKSRFLNARLQGSTVAASAIDLDKPESALEKYRRRKETRDNATRLKLESLTNQSKDSGSEKYSNGSSIESSVPNTAGSSSEGIKFKIDLSSIKDFLRKTEEEISKLPRYIREPWTMTEMLSSRRSSDSGVLSTSTQASENELDNNFNGISTLSPAVDENESNSRKSSSNSMEGLPESSHGTRNTDGDNDIYLDAKEAIDISHMDTLMPLPDSRDIERRCRSVTPNRVLANTEKVLSQTDRILKKSRSGNSLRKSYSRSMGAANIERLSEVVADLAEEHSTAQLAGERLEAEQADRMRLEKDLDGAQSDTRALTLATERLESEKTALRTEMLQQASCFNNGDIAEPEDATSASLYKRKFEWSQREVESLKQQLRQHQQDEQEQSSLLKKQLEKKVGDAREETEEQRQVAGQLKKRTQRLQAEMNDLKILLEEQAARNSLLEKKQRKFDSDLSAGQDELRVERLNKDKVMRERDAHLAEKYAVDQELSTLKLELELRDERVAALTRQVDELSVSEQGDQEITQLRKSKHELESKIKDQEEELDELAGQVQMLEAARTRLEMSIEQMRKENRKEVQQREEEMEEVRISAQKKVKALEAQVEAEHEDRTQLMRDKHELERRMLEVMDRSSVAPDEDAIHRLKKDLRKTKALLKDTQTMLEKSQSEGPSKLIIRQLKTQLEDCEFAKTAALKARQSADDDLSEIQSCLEETQRARKDAEDRGSRLLKEKTELQTQLEEGEELHVETLKKYKSTVSQISIDQITLSDQSQRISELEHVKQMLSERLQELSSKVEVLEGETANIHTQRMLQMKVKELESKLELEAATRKRIEGQVSRQKEQMERLSGECDISKCKESQSLDQTKKLNRQLRQAREEAAMLQQRNTELSSKKQEIEKQMELMDSEIATLKSDLKLAFKRIEDLQMALQGDISDSDSELSDSDSDTSLTNYLSSSVRVSRSSTSSSYAGASSNVVRQPNRTGASPTNRGEDLMSPGSDAMAIIEEAKEEMQHSESESFA